MGSSGRGAAWQHCCSRGVSKREGSSSGPACQRKERTPQPLPLPPRAPPSDPHPPPACLPPGPAPACKNKTRYRAAEEMRHWRARDPVTRFQLWLQGRGWWDEGRDGELRQAARKEVRGGKPCPWAWRGG